MRLVVVVLLGALLAGADGQTVPGGDLVQGGGLLAFAWAVYHQGQRLITAFEKLSAAVAVAAERIARLEVHLRVQAPEGASVPELVADSPSRGLPRGSTSPPTR